MRAKNVQNIEKQKVKQKTLIKFKLNDIIKTT